MEETAGMPTEWKELDPKVLETLAKYDSPTICNVIELLKVQPNTEGYMNGSIRAIYPKIPPVVGYASTATFRSAYPSTGADVYKRVTDHIEELLKLPSPRFVVIQDLDEPPAAAILGEVMGRLYKRFGAAGFVTNGAVRDLLQVEAINFPVFAKDVIVSHGYPRLEEVHVPVHVGGVTVRPGDLIHADANGVVSIPLKLAALVADGCEEFVAAEKSIMDFLEDSNTTLEEYRKAWDRTAKAMDTLSSRLKKSAAAL
jgi:regulator of RNase E activity RraA